MNEIEKQIIENYIYEKVREIEDQVPSVLYAVLGNAGQFSIKDEVLELIQRGRYVEPDEMIITSKEMDVLIEYAEEKHLDLSLGMKSVIETFVLDQIGIILDMELLEYF